VGEAHPTKKLLHAARYNGRVTAPPLDYAPSKRRRPALRRLSILLLVVASVCLWHYRNAILDRAKLLLAQHRCLNYSAPPTLLVYETDTGRGDRLGTAEGTRCEQQYPSSPYSPYGPALFRKIDARESLLRILPSNSPPPISFFGIPAGPGNTATIFLHARRANAGAERLVALDWDGNQIHAQVIRPASGWRGAEVLSQQWIDDDLQVFKIALIFNDEKHLGTQIFAGQPDPKDESRFTIDCCCFGVNFRLLGQLLPNDTISIRLPNAGIEQQVERVYGPSS
jgi:hypothetical protein